MKYLILFVLCVQYSFAQVPKEYQKMNTIQIETGLSKADAHKKLVDSLYESGFVLEKYDVDSGIFETGPKATKYGAETMIRGRLQDSKIEARYFTRVDVTLYGVRSYTWDPQNLKPGTGYKKAAFDDFIQVLSAFEGPREYFEK